MGERVVINPASAAPSEAPPRVVPLDYGHGGRASDWWRKFSAAFAERAAGAIQFLGMMIGLIGGVRQLVFAIGLAFLAGGLADALSHGHDDAVIAKSFGGFLIGLVLPVPKRKG